MKIENKEYIANWFYPAAISSVPLQPENGMSRGGCRRSSANNAASGPGNCYGFVVMGFSGLK